MQFCGHQCFSIAYFSDTLGYNHLYSWAANTAALDSLPSWLCACSHFHCPTAASPAKNGLSSTRNGVGLEVAKRGAAVTKGVRGTRDFYPEDMRIRNWLFDNFQSAARSHGFEEYDSPVLEHEELYTRKQGEEITQQLYNFEDKGGRKVALRPEMTPSLARMVMARAGAPLTPIKWFSIPQCWRYERTQRGRGREHYQWNVDIWGSDAIQADAELLGTSLILRGVGLNADDPVILNQ